jgi:amidohydrolase
VSAPENNECGEDRLDSLKERVCAAVDGERERLIELSHRIHAHPELRFAEERASAWLAEYLAGQGFEVEHPAYGLPTAFAARLGAGRPRVAILCEYDALPEIGHACGHNVIATAGVGAAVGLRNVVGDLSGSVVVLGTPAEEGGGGKIIMASAGAFADVDAALMIHPAGADLLAIDALAITALEVVYRGRPAHAAAAPQRGINALDALVTAYNAIAQLRQHIGANERIHGIITDGGQAPNVVPARAAGLFYVRAATTEELRVLKERVCACFRAGATASGAELEIRTRDLDYSNLLSNGVLAAVYAANLERVGRRLTDTEGAVTGSTDMGNVSKIVPSIHPMIAIAPPEVALHTREFAQWAASERGDRGVIDGAKLLAMTALDVLVDPAIRTAMAVDFAAGTAAG